MPVYYISISTFIYICLFTLNLIIHEFYIHKLWLCLLLKCICNSQINAPWCFFWSFVDMHRVKNVILQCSHAQLRSDIRWHDAPLSSALSFQAVNKCPFSHLFKCHLFHIFVLSVGGICCLTCPSSPQGIEL